MYYLIYRTGIALITCHLLQSTQANNHTKRFYCSMMNQVIICILMDVSNTLIGIAHSVFYGVTARSVILSLKVVHILANSAEREFWFEWFAYCNFGNFREGFIFAKLFDKTIAKQQKLFVLYWCRNIMPKSRISTMANMSFKAIRKNSNSREYFRNYSIGMLRPMEFSKEV